MRSQALKDRIDNNLNNVFNKRDICYENCVQELVELAVLQLP